MGYTLSSLICCFFALYALHTLCYSSIPLLHIPHFCWCHCCALVKVPLFSQVPSFPPSSCWRSWHVKTCPISPHVTECLLVIKVHESLFISHDKVWYYGWILSIFYKLTFYPMLEERNAQWNGYDNSDLLIFVGLFLINLCLIY